LIPSTSWPFKSPINPHPMKKFLHSCDGASRGAALIIVLAFVVLVTALAAAYFSRTTTDRQLAQSSYNDTSSDLLARSALDITVSDLKQEILAHPTPTAAPPYYIQPARYPAGIPDDNPNLIRYSSRNAAASRASTVRSTDASANGRSISLARWNSHYLIPPASATGTDSTPVNSFIPPDWVLVTRNGPVAFSAWQNDLKDPTSANSNYVVGRYAFAVYDEGGLIDVNVAGFPTYASLSRPTPTRRLHPRYPLEESEIMLAACQPPDFNGNQNPPTGTTGQPFSYTPRTNHQPTSFGPDTLPHGLTVNPSTGLISGVPTSPGVFTITLRASNNCGTATITVPLIITGLITPDSTPWPVNLARKGTLAFADLTALPSTPTAITPTWPVGSMGGFPSPTPINKMMGWRNYATTKQPTSASFNTPSFALASADNFASNFLGAAYPLATSFTTVSTAVQNSRTDQAAMTRQELIKLQRTIDNPSGQFPQTLLQYLGTFSRDMNRPAQDWPLANGQSRLSGRFDMTNLQVVIPGFRVRPGNNGKGHAWGLQKKSDLYQLFGLTWLDGTWGNGDVAQRFIDPNYYGHWVYGSLPGHRHDVTSLPDNPDFFQIINYALTLGNGGVAPAPSTVFTIGAALIDQYDGDDLNDPDPNYPGNADNGNTITIIDYGGASYAYGIEAMSYDDPNLNLARPPLAPNPLLLGVLANYVLLNRRFENVGEFGYAYNPASDPLVTPSRTLDFASATSKDRAILDFFTYNEASPRAGIVNLNTKNIPVLASIIKGALLNDPGLQNTPTALLSQTSDALNAAQAIIQETTNTSVGHGPALTRADVTRLAAVAAARLPPVLGVSDETKQTIARALADTGQARTWNLIIDVIAQTGHYGPNAQDLTAFIPEGEKRYWLHIALDRDDGRVLGSQLEEVIE
jgi:Putative Ig domain